MKKIFFIGLVCSSFAFTAFMMSSWNLTDDYVISFDGRGASGNFSDLLGEIVFDPEDLSSARMNVSVAVSTIETGNKTKNKHARGGSWFDAEQFPKITLQSNKFNQTTNGYEFIGQMTMHGTTRDITFPFTFSPTANGGIFAGEFIVNRQDYGIRGPFMAFTVADEFRVQLKVPVIR